MSDHALFGYRCLFCENETATGEEFALHLEEHFLARTDQGIQALLPRVVARPPVGVPLFM